MIAHSETYQVKSPATGDEPVVQLYESVVFFSLATCAVPRPVNYSQRQGLSYLSLTYKIQLPANLNAQI